ncbi:motility-associated protein, partial [Pseudoalteromonas nigrifaciens]
MDKLSVLGLLIGLGAIAIGYSLEGGVVSALFNGPALIIVLGGTLGAVMLQTSASTFKKMLEITHWVFVSPKYNIEDAIEQVKGWSHKARQEGYLA